MKKSAFKSLVAPDRPLRPEELRQCIEQADREWACMSDSDRRAWHTKHFAANFCRRFGAASTLCDEGCNSSHRGLWGHVGRKDELVPLDVLGKHGVGQKRDRAWHKQIWHDEGLNVREAKSRRSQLQHQHHWDNIDGCLNEKKLCCVHGIMDLNEVALLDHITKMLSAVVDSLGKQQVDLCDSLLRFVGFPDEAEAAEVLVFALIVDARYSPKMQYLAICRLVDVDVQDALSSRFPFDIEICAREPRLPGNQGLVVCDISTSDECHS